MRQELTDAYLRSLRPPERGRIELRDAVVRGLALRITPTGTASWSVHVRTHNGKRTRPLIGTWPKIGIRDARIQARKLLGEIAKGEDPVERKRSARAERAARAALPTVAQRLADWRKAKAGRWSPRYAAEIDRLCEKLIEPVLGKRPLAATTRQDWVDMITAHRTRRPASATWLFQLSSAFLNHAEAHGWIEQALLPRKGLTVIAPKVDARQRALDDDELVRVWRASERLSAKSRCFVRLLIGTACRVGEAANIALGELNVAAARWTIPAERAKNRRAITLPLHPLLLAELTAVTPEARTPGFRLLGHFPGSGLQGISGIKRRLDAACGVANWTMHDLRRTARTGMARLGVDGMHAEAALNHVSGRSALERTYNVHDYAAEVVAAITVWQRHVAELVQGASAGAEVIELRRA